MKLKNSEDFTLENRIPFPFIQTCFILGAAYDSRLHNPFPFFYPVVPYEMGISPMNLLWNNQTGHTIVDITDTDQLRYCFMFPPSPPSSPAISDQSDEPPDEDEPLRCRPLTLEEYLSCPGIVEADIDVDLSRWRLITPNTLRELWPKVPWPDQNDRAPCSQQIPHCDKETTMPSLTDLSFRKVIEEALDNPRVEEELELTENMLDFSRRLRQLLYESPESVKRPCGIALLGRAIRTEKTLDFSPFPWFEEDAILQVVEKNTMEVTSIDLSCNGNVSVALVAKLLVLCLKITTLAAVQTPNLPFEALSKALVRKSQIELYHSDLFRAAFDEPKNRDDEDDGFTSSLANLPNHTAPNGTLSQILFFSINRDIRRFNSLRLKGGGLKWSKLAQSWSDRSLSKCDFFGATIPLHDAFLNPSYMGT